MELMMHLRRKRAGASPKTKPPRAGGARRCLGQQKGRVDSFEKDPLARSAYWCRPLAGEGHKGRIAEPLPSAFIYSKFGAAGEASVDPAALRQHAGSVADQRDAV